MRRFATKFYHRGCGGRILQIEGRVGNICAKCDKTLLSSSQAISKEELKALRSASKAWAKAWHP